MRGIFIKDRSVIKDNETVNVAHHNVFLKVETSWKHNKYEAGILF